MDSKKAPASEPLLAKRKVPETVTKTAGCLARQMALGSALHSASTMDQMWEEKKESSTGPMLEARRAQPTGHQSVSDWALETGSKMGSEKEVESEMGKE